MASIKSTDDRIVLLWSLMGRVASKPTASADNSDWFNLTCLLSLHGKSIVRVNTLISERDVRAWLSELRGVATNQNNAAFKTDTKAHFEIILLRRQTNLTEISLWYPLEKSRDKDASESSPPILRGFRFSTDNSHLMAFIVEITREFSTLQQPEQ